jgi:uncharacterized membrane protein
MTAVAFVALGIAATTIVYFGSLAPSLETTRIIFEKLVDVDGVLVGFAGVIFGISGKLKPRFDTALMVVSSCVACYMFSIVLCLLGLALNATTGLLIGIPVYATIMGTELLFSGIAFVRYAT